MPTLKKRLNITLSPEMEWAIMKIAKRDNVPASTKASELIYNALMTSEDEIWDKMASDRYEEKSKRIPHSQAWK